MIIFLHLNLLAGQTIRESCTSQTAHALFSTFASHHNDWVQIRSHINKAKENSCVHEDGLQNMQVSILHGFFPPQNLAPCLHTMPIRYVPSPRKLMKSGCCPVVDEGTEFARSNVMRQHRNVIAVSEVADGVTDTNNLIMNTFETHARSNSSIT
jgi:hypothetical protein